MKGGKGKDGESVGCGSGEVVGGGVGERVKYWRKGGDMVGEGEWLLEVRGERDKGGFVGRGGGVKEVVKVEEERDEEMVMGDDIWDGEEDG